MPSMVNASLETLTLKNTESSSAIPTRYFAAYDKTNIGGMLLVTNGSAGQIAGLVEQYGTDSTTGLGVPTPTIPAGQSSRVRHRGVGACRAAAVSCVEGTPAYVEITTGRVTNTSNSSANPRIGIFRSSTGGTVDEVVAVDINTLN